MNSEPAAAFARDIGDSPSTIAEALIGHVSEPDDRPTRRQPALELLALHEASALGGNAADDLAVPIAAAAELAAAEPAAAEPAAAESVEERAAADLAAEPAFERGVVAPAVERGVVAPAFERGVVAPAVERGVVAPAVERGVAAPAVERGVVAPAVERGVVEPAVARVVAEPAIGRGVAEPAVERGAVESVAEPAVARGVAESAAEPAVGRGAVESAAEPAVERGVAEPAVERDVAEPAVERGVAEPAVERGAVESAAEPAVGRGAVESAAEPAVGRVVAEPAAEPTAVEVAAAAPPDAAEPVATSCDFDPTAGTDEPTAPTDEPPTRNLLSTAIDAVPKEIDDAHTEAASGAPTTRTPALDTDDAHPDRVAERRGLPPIAEPYVRDRNNRRGWLIASGAFSIACLAVAVFVVVWARGEVQRARAERSVVRPLVASNGPAPIASPSASPSMSPSMSPSTSPSASPSASPSTSTVSMARSAPVPPSAPAQVAPSCAMHVTTNIDGATVYIDGIPHGAAPADVPVACGIDTLVELRHPRYEGFKRSLSVADGTLEVDAHLDREKTELTVWSDPPGATVTYNGHPIGKTPLVTKVNRYERGTLWFRAPGRQADWRKIVPKEPAKTVSVKLKPRS